MATVTLKGTNAYSPAAEFSADSGDETGHARYSVALTLATERMLDFEYRSNQAERPELGHIRF